MERALVTVKGKFSLADKIAKSFYYSEAMKIMESEIKNLQE